MGDESPWHGSCDPAGVDHPPESTGAALAPSSVPPAPVRDEDAERREETRLMARFRDRGEARDFEELYRRTSGRIARWVAAQAGGSGLARVRVSELVQDVFVNVYRYAGSFRDEHAGSFRAWARTIARNVVRRRLGTGRGPAFVELAEGVAEPEDRRLGPARAAVEGEERESLARGYALLLSLYARAYAELSPRDRLALELVEIRGLSYAEASRRLRVGMSNMKMIIFRARRRLRARLSAWLEAAEERRAAG